MISEIFLGLARRYEGLRLKAYLCPAGIPTIGYGHTGGVKLGDTITAEEAEALLKKDAAIYEMGAANLSPILWTDEKRRAAIADFCFNLGLGRYKASTLRRRVEAGDWEGAEAELNKWVWGGGKKLPGLVKRRAEEAALINGG
jgi:lysozyme